MAPPVHRKSAMRVRDGQVAKKNNWTPDHGDYYARSQAEIRVERRHPGAGFRHLVTVAQVRQMLALLPNWDELAIGLEAVVIAEGNDGYLGLSNPGVVLITAWPQDLWWDSTHITWVRENDEVLGLLGVEMAPGGTDPNWLELRWTEGQARAFLLADVLRHELGHHHDRMTGTRPSADRGEPFAHAYTTRIRTEIWPRYLDTFGI